MSDPKSELSTSMNAKEITSLAATWIERSTREDWTEKDQTDLSAWLDKSSAHRIAYWRLDGAWNETYRLAALRSPRSEPEAEVKGRGFLSGLAIAATAVVIAIIGVAASLRFVEPKTVTYATAIGGHKTVTLDDGSLIELNTATVLRVSDGGQRKVWLDRGEAYFQVKHDPARPFVVMASGHRVTDIGTKFMVRRNTASLEVAVVEGRVRFDAADKPIQSATTLLNPGDVAVASAGSLSVINKPARILSDELGWRRGVLVFNHTTLAEAAAEFNRYNREKLAVFDPAVAHVTIGGTFQMDNIKDFVDLAQTVLGLRVEKRGDETVISR
jgi:transmembrane sensor